MVRPLIRLAQRRLLHSHRVLSQEWTKASLRRMKKVELTRLAKENHLELSGTKNDIIIQLLTHQTAKIVGSSTPAIQTIEDVASTAMKGQKEEETDADNEWMNAFEMKVAQRGSRKPVDKTNDHFTSATKSRPHRFNDQLNAKPLLQPVKENIELEETSDNNTTIKSSSESKTVMEEIEGMDPQWVEAFDLKVGSRAARRTSVDTLSPTAMPSLTDQLKFIQLDNKADEDAKDARVLKEEAVKKPKETIPVGKKFGHVKKHTEKHGKQHFHNDIKKEHNLEQDKNTPRSNTDQTTEEGNKQDNGRGTWISTTVGSSMLLWYFGGDEGISKIWHFLTSTSS